MIARKLSAAPAIVGLLLVACQTITEELPQTPAPVSPAGGSPVIVIVPVPIPSPATPNPTPAPPGNPNPAPNPAPTSGPPSSQGCGVGAGNGSGNNCPAQSPSFLREVESAMDQLIAQEPGIFDLRRTRGGCANCYFVTNPDRYVQRMAQLMSERGLCGFYDGEELAVKRTNQFNDQYDIYTSDGFIRRQLGSYRTTCYPAWF